MASIVDEMHPNWRALATIHLPLKRFIREGTEATNAGKTSSNEKYEIHGVSGEEVRQFYDAILQQDLSGKADSSKTATSSKLIKNINNKQNKVNKQAAVPFNAKLFYRYAMENNVGALKNMSIGANDVNACDEFGWTALMMAACEGALDAVIFLIEKESNTEVKDKSGRTAMDLAEKKGHASIVQLLQRKELKRSSSAGMQNEQKIQNLKTKKPFYCCTCKSTFAEASESEHQTSTVHQFNAEPSAYTHTLGKFNIPQRNRGLQLMLKQGWDKESGLGPTQTGRLYPVKTVIRKQRTGLGVEQPPARVTHYNAYDTRATERNHPYNNTRKRSLNDMRSEKLREWKRERRLRNELS